MDQLQDVVQAGTFWTAVGSLAAVAAVIVALLQGQPKKKKVSRAEQERITMQAEEAAKRFDYWIRNYMHYGERTDTEKLIEWLEADHGYAKVAEDYDVFRKMAEALVHQRYNTQVPPTEAEFISAVSRAKARELRG